MRFVPACFRAAGRRYAMRIVCTWIGGRKLLPVHIFFLLVVSFSHLFSNPLHLSRETQSVVLLALTLCITLEKNNKRNKNWGKKKNNNKKKKKKKNKVDILPLFFSLIFLSLFFLSFFLFMIFFYLLLFIFVWQSSFCGVCFLFPPPPFFFLKKIKLNEGEKKKANAFLSALLEKYKHFLSVRRALVKFSYNS